MAGRAGPDNFTRTIVANWQSPSPRVRCVYGTDSRGLQQGDEDKNIGPPRQQMTVTVNSKSYFISKKSSEDSYDYTKYYLIHILNTYIMMFPVSSVILFTIVSSKCMTN